jgi:hypothetical protein
VHTKKLIAIGVALFLASSASAFAAQSHQGNGGANNHDGVSANHDRGLDKSDRSGGGYSGNKNDNVSPDPDPDPDPEKDICDYGFRGGYGGYGGWAGGFGNYGNYGNFGGFGGWH